MYIYIYISTSTVPDTFGFENKNNAYSPSSYLEPPVRWCC